MKRREQFYSFHNFTSSGSQQCNNGQFMSDIEIITLILCSILSGCQRETVILDKMQAIVHRREAWMTISLQRNNSPSMQDFEDLIVNRLLWSVTLCFTHAILRLSLYINLELLVCRHYGLIYKQCIGPILDDRLKEKILKP